MSYTPVELRHVQVGRSLLGYKRDDVEKILDEVADSFETVWRDRGDLAERVEQLEEQLGELKAREELLTRTLASAEQVAVDVREQAKRDADLILAEAHQQARSIQSEARAERERLVAEARRIEVFLRAALESVAEGTPAVAPPEAEEPQPWPRRDETQEYPRGEAPERDPDEAPAPGAALPAAPLRRFLPKVVGGETREFDWGD
jgi:cell division initiation protein